VDPAGCWGPLGQGGCQLVSFRSDESLEVCRPVGSSSFDLRGGRDFAHVRCRVQPAHWCAVEPASDVKYYILVGLHPLNPLQELVPDLPELWPDPS
jgi:hypothetical protein